VTSGSVDAGANQLTVNFSEPVQWTNVNDAQFVAHGSGGTIGLSVNPGASGPVSSFNFDLTTTGMAGPTGTLDYLGSPLQITSVATGLPLQPFTGLLVPITF
jgi:hypothetical protein